MKRIKTKELASIPIKTEWDTVVGNYLKKKRKTLDKYEYIVLEDSPCAICLTLAFCLNKDEFDIIICPILRPTFHALVFNTEVDHNSIVRLHPLTISFWIQRDSEHGGHVDVIKNNVLTFVSTQIAFDEFKLEDIT